MQKNGEFRIKYLISNYNGKYAYVFSRLYAKITVENGETYVSYYTGINSLTVFLVCGGLAGYNFLSGEPIANIQRGIPLVARTPDGTMNLANFMKMQIYSALGSLAIGCEILSDEKVEIDNVCGHGGFFKTPFVGQSAMSAALGSSVTVMQNAGEGGAWGVAIF